MGGSFCLRKHGRGSFIVATAFLFARNAGAQGFSNILFSRLRMKSRQTKGGILP